MTIYTRFLTALCLFTALAAPALAQHPGMKPGMTHDQHLAEIDKQAALKKRGAAAMGFDQDAATHHFRLLADGGVIEVTANDTADSAGRDQIRTHLREIVAAFAHGDFTKPFATHDEVPPGVPGMQERQGSLRFSYEEMPNGGRVRITTGDAKAKNSVHEFLRYQIQEHATGDPLTVGK